MMLKKRIVVSWLKKSKLFRVIEDENEEFEVPDSCYKDNESISSMNDWILVKNVCQYWDCDEFPLSFIIFAIKNPKEMTEYFKTLNYEEISILQNIIKGREKVVKMKWSFKWFHYILEHSDKQWNYSKLCKNPNVVWELIQVCSQKLNDYNQISSNINITWDIVQAHPMNAWNYNNLSSNPNITWNIVEDNQDKPWNYAELTLNPNITIDIIRKHPEKPWLLSNLSRNPSITFQDVLEHTDIPWLPGLLSNNPNITYIIIKNNRNFGWNNLWLSKNNNINWNDIINENSFNENSIEKSNLIENSDLNEILNKSSFDNSNENEKSNENSNLIENSIKKIKIESKYPKIQWNYLLLASNSNINWDIFTTNRQYFKDLSWFVCNPNINWEIIENNETINWNYDMLSANTFETMYYQYLDEILMNNQQFESVSQNVS